MLCSVSAFYNGGLSTDIFLGFVLFDWSQNFILKADLSWCFWIFQLNCSVVGVFHSFPYLVSHLAVCLVPQVAAREAEVGMIATRAAGETTAASGTATTTGGMITDQRKPLATKLKMEGDTAPTAVSMAPGLTPTAVAAATAATDSPVSQLLSGLKISRISSLVATSQGQCRTAWPNHSFPSTPSSSCPSQWHSL